MPNTRGVSRRGFLVKGATGLAATAATAAALAPIPAAADEHDHMHMDMQLAQAQAPTGTPAPGATAAPAAGGPSATGTPAAGQPTQAQPQAPPLGGFVFFNNFQAAVVAAAAARIIPTDQNGPGADEAGVVYFIDQQLNGDYGLVGRRYTHGPWQQGTPTQGDQSGMPMRERYRLGINGMEDYSTRKFGKGFAQLAADQQDAVLRDMEAGRADGFDGPSIQAAPTQPGGSGTETSIQRMAPGGMGVGSAAFFQILRGHTMAGFFADPVHGGNRGMVGWKLIGFPGVQTNYNGWISRYGDQFNGPFRSLADYQQQFGKGGA